MHGAFIVHKDGPCNPKIHKDEIPIGLALIKNASMQANIDADRRRALLLEVQNEKGWNTKEWCRKAGVTPTAVYNFLRGQSRSLSLPILERLASTARVPIGRLTGEPGLVKIDVPSVQIIGVVRAGLWHETPEYLAGIGKEIVVPLPEEYRESAFGLEIAGPSMNQFFPEGSFVVCLPIEELPRELKSHDKVVVLRERAGLYEHTLKELVIDENTGRPWLWPRSTDPNFQTPIEIPDGEPTESEEIRILAVVIGSYRPEPI